MRFTTRRDFFMMAGLTALGPAFVKAGPEAASLAGSAVADPNRGPWAGPNSSLSWSSGCYSGYSPLYELRRNPAWNLVREFDAVQTFWWPGTFVDFTGAKLIERAKTSVGCPWQIVKSRGVRFLTCAVRAFSAGAPGGSAANTYARQRVLATWPVKGMIQPDAFINSAFPVGWQDSGLTVEQQQERVVDVWAHAADGHFDHLWREPLIAIRDALTFEGLGSTLVVLRPWWEGNKAATWGENHSIFSVSYASAIRPATALADRDVVKAAFRRYADVARNVWPNYLLHFNPHKDNTKTQPTAVKITDWWDPVTWDTIGPNPYDTGCATGELYNNGSNLDRWNIWANKENSYGPVGVSKWLAWARGNSTAEHPVRLSYGEWGCYVAGEGTDPGGDNPLYIEKMYDHFEDAAASGNMGYEVYFNVSTHLLTPVGGVTAMPNASAAYRAQWAKRPVRRR